MALVPWRQKRKAGETSPLAELRHEMDRLFDAFMRDPIGSLSETFGGQRAWVPTVDVTQTDHEVVVRAELPGVDPHQLDLSISGNQLTLSGEKKESSEHVGKDAHVVESRFGSFRRTIDLPSSVDPSQVTAECSQGVLTVRLKKSPTETVQRIPIQSQP